MLTGAFRYSAASPVPTRRQWRHAEVWPAGLTQYVLNNFAKKSPPYHVTQDDVSTPLRRLELEKITGHQSVRGRGGVIAVMYETHWTCLSGSSWERASSFFATRYCATGRALRISTAKPTACAGGCELVLHNGNFLGTTASDSWRTDTAASLAQNGLAPTAPRCFPTEATFGTSGTRLTTVCGGLGRSAPARPRRGHVWCVVRFLDDPGRSRFPLLRRATRLRQERYEVLGAYNYA